MLPVFRLSLDQLVSTRSGEHENVLLGKDVTFKSRKCIMQSDLASMNHNETRLARHLPSSPLILHDPYQNSRRFEIDHAPSLAIGW